MTTALPVDRASLAAFPPVSPTVFPTGSRGWLVSAPTQARAALADPRLADLPMPAARTPAGDHDRPLLATHLTTRRMDRLDVGTIVAEQLDFLATQGKPADLVAEFAQPVSAMVSCELLGVGRTDRDWFQGVSQTLLGLHTTPAEAAVAGQELRTFLRELARSRRRRPADDLMSAMATGSDRTDEQLADVAAHLAEHGSTANLLSLGTFALLRHPAQLALLRENPALTADAVEELLRYLSAVALVAVRVATVDLTLAGAQVKAGETVLFSMPDSLDLTRGRTPHLAFGHGAHQCLGQRLARVQLRVGIRQLLDRFPGLELAVPPEQVPMRTDLSIYGVHALPVTW